MENRIVEIVQGGINNRNKIDTYTNYLEIEKQIIMKRLYGGIK